MLTDKLQKSLADDLPTFNNIAKRLGLEPVAASAAPPR